jgi:hypothetical protein
MKQQKNKKEILYQYLFWYNVYEDLWYAIKSDTILNFFNGNRKKSEFYKAKKHSDLIKMIN